MTRAYIGGTFDLFHIGHVFLLSRAKSEFDEVVVSLNTDEFCERYKGERPVMELAERAAVIAACRYVDKVDVNDGCEDSTLAVLRNAPTHIIHGDDWKGESLKKQMGLTDAFLVDNRIELIYFPYTKRTSTGDIKERIWANQPTTSSSR